MGDDEADQGFEDHGRDCEDAGLFDDQPKGFTLEQEFEIAEANEPRHRLVQRRQMQGVEGRIKHQERDKQDERQRHQEGRRRFSLQRLV